MDDVMREFEVCLLELGIEMFHEALHLQSLLVTVS